MNLIQKIKKKDSISIESLYTSYGKKLYGFAITRWQVTEDDAWELVYKTLYKFLEVKDRYTFENEKKLQAFLFQSFINNLRNLYNEKKSKHIETMPLDENTNETEPQETDTENEHETERSTHMICLKKILEQRKN